MSNRKYIDRLREWLEALNNIRCYRDEYDNICYGTMKQKHIVHLHTYNLHADIEVNDLEKYNYYKTKYDLLSHDWKPKKWLIVDTNNSKNYHIAKEIISWVYEN